ncbi:MAG: ATP-binding cassette domain-containing protein, partial [Spirochaetaceae bacterium]|nr:ATP-binding cassette domain-containing protein [Spirochaetaceae bacterium]
MIETVGLCAGYKNNEVLKNLSFTLKEKGLNVLLGANGSGKSTLLSLIAGVPNASLECTNEPL